MRPRPNPRIPARADRGSDVGDRTAGRRRSPARRPERGPARGRPRDAAGRSRSWPAPGPARRGSSAAEPRTPSRPASCPPDQVLVVTFTDKAAGEMVDAAGRARAARGRRAHVPRPRPVRSFASSGRRATTASRCPGCSTSKLPLLIRIARGLPGHYRFTPGPGPGRRDRVGQGARHRARGLRDRARDAATPPIPADLMRARVRRLRASQDAGGPDRLRRPAGRDDRAARDRRGGRRRSSGSASAGSASTSTRTPTRSSSGCWSCGRATSDDICVVGDEDQTIYTLHRRDVVVSHRLRRAPRRRPGSSP